MKAQGHEGPVAMNLNVEQTEIYHREADGEM